MTPDTLPLAYSLSPSPSSSLSSSSSSSPSPPSPAFPRVRSLLPAPPPGLCRLRHSRLLQPIPAASTPPVAPGLAMGEEAAAAAKIGGVTLDMVSNRKQQQQQQQTFADIPIATTVTLPILPASVADGLPCSLLDSSHKKQICLFYCTETEDLARRIAAQTDTIELKSINWRTFADGFPNLFVPNAHGIRGQHVAFLASFSSPGVIFEQLSVIYALPRMFVSSFTLVLPFFPTGTFERMEDEGDIATAFTLARILSNIPISRGGPTSLVVFDIHALQERFYFGDNVLPCFESGIPLLKQRLHQLPDSNNVSIAFPDEGAWKRFHNLLQHFPTIICTKVREGDKRIVRLKEGEAAGQHVVIVDDLVQSGGTLLECKKVLLAHGASKISAYATHGVFPKRSWEKFVPKENDDEQGFSHFWITDSCPLTVREVNGSPPFEVLSLAGSIAAALHI